MEIKVIRNILEANEKASDAVRKLLSERKIFMMNVMGSPGAGKTTFISSIIRNLSDNYKIGVIEGDIETVKDSEKVSAMGIPVVQINTSVFGGDCHLEASWIYTALEDLPLNELDLVIIENIGNLVCPAEFDVGDDLSIVILSIPEGEDKPVKYPLMFRKAEAMVLSKSSVFDAFEYNMDELKSNVGNVNGDLPVFLTDAKSGDGMDSFFDYFKAKIDNKIDKQ